jgi:hypothetical protein
MDRSITPALKKLRQEFGELEFSLGYITRPCSKKRKERKSKKNTLSDLAYLKN